MTKQQLRIPVCLALILATLFLGQRLPGRPHYLISTLVVLESMLPFLLSFERRKPQARELAVIAVLCALAVAARAAIPIPNFKAIFAVIMLSGMALGAETGFLVGAVSALVSNFFFGQGPYTPWQMLAYGLSGLAAGLLFRIGLLKRSRMSMAVWGSLTVFFLVGPVLDTCAVFLTLTELTPAGMLPIYLSGIPVNLSQSASTALTMWFFGEALLEKLDRVKARFEFGGNSHGT